MSKKILAALVVAVFFVSTTTSEAIDWFKISKLKPKVTPRPKPIPKPSLLPGLTNEVISFVLAGLVIKQFQEYPVEPEIQQAMNNGETSYQTRICNTPDGVVEVPQYFKVCPDGSEVTYGEPINLKK